MSLLLASCNEPVKKTDINSLPPERIQALTAQAYFSYLLIMNYATMYKQAINPNLIHRQGHSL